MNIVASFLGLGAPELAFLVTIVVGVAIIFVVVKGFMKGYSRNNKD